MNPRFSRIARLVAFLAIPISGAGAQVFYPIRGLVDQSTGVMESEVDGVWFRGSAVIARDPRLLYSCAHLFFENGKWATDYVFSRAYHDRSYPAGDVSVSPRGLHYFTSYSSGVKSYGADSEMAFASDFTVLYGNSEFGTAVGCWPKGGPALRSTRSKRVVGYPSRIDFTGEAGGYYQHATHWFDFAAFQVFGGYHEFNQVSTGTGNSGGPVFVKDTAGNDYLAGILVAGTRRTAGVLALDLSTDTMAGYALGLKDKTASFNEEVARKLPDGVRSYTTIPIQVSGFTGSIAKLKLSISVTTGHRGDLDVYLRSPSGRIRWISRQAGGSSDHLEIDSLNLSNTFRGYAANGTWEIRIRDAVSGTRATFRRASLTVTAL